MLCLVRCMSDPHPDPGRSPNGVKLNWLTQFEIGNAHRRSGFMILRKLGMYYYYANELHSDWLYVTHTTSCTWPGGTVACTFQCVSAAGWWAARGPRLFRFCRSVICCSGADCDGQWSPLLHCIQEVLDSILNLTPSILPEVQHGFPKFFLEDAYFYILNNSSLIFIL
jgi:hypothetical protein